MRPQRAADALGPLAEVLIPSAQRQAHIAGFARFAASGQGSAVNQRVELQALHKNGGEIPIELSAAVLRGERRYFEGQLKRRGRDVFFQPGPPVPALDVHGHVQGFYVMTFDVTPVRRVQLSQQRSEERLRQIANSLPVLISYVDSHHFKRINDALGQAGGDAVQKEFAKRLSASVRASDTVARLGHDEFVVVLRNAFCMTAVAQLQQHAGSLVTVS